jgi:Holliday junction resolvase RusA-like endonuclease
MMELFDRTETFVQPDDNNIHLTILGDPKPQKRHRSVKIAGFTRQYDPSQADKGDFLSIVQGNAPVEPFSCPLAVSLRFYFSRPKGHYRSGKNSHLLKDDAPLWHTSRPDFDNLGKFCADALNKIYWKDDSYIVSCTITKQYDLRPRTEIHISKI